MIDSISKTELPGGISVITDHMPHALSVSIGIWIDAGSAIESADNNGISHFLEHMLFKGTEKRNALEIAKSLEVKGGNLNGSTGKDSSLYTAYILKEDAELAVEILADILQNPILQKEAIELEKQVILTEIVHSEETPEEMVIDYLYSNLFPNHPLGFFIYGTAENVLLLNRDALVEFLLEHYLSTRIICAAAGNIEHDQFVRLIEKNFKKIHASRKNGIPEILTGPLRGIRHHIDKGSQQAHIAVGTRMFGYHDQRKYDLALLDIILGGGMSSRLFQNIREKYGFAYAVYSYFDIMATTGTFGAYLGCPIKYASQSIELLLQEFSAMAHEPVSSIELDNAKTQLKGGLKLVTESTFSRMRRIGEIEFYNGEHLSIDQVMKKIDKVSAEDLMQLADEFLNPENISITLLSPKAKK